MSGALIPPGRLTVAFIALLLAVSIGTPGPMSPHQLSGWADGATITVDAGGGADYTGIQDAVDNATAGDVVEIAEGTYFESVLVNVSITLQGEGSSLTVISGDWTAPVVHVTADDVVIRDLGVTVGLGAGILVEGVTGGTLSGLHGTGINGSGLEVSHSQDVVVEGCLFNENLILGPASGVYIPSSEGCRVVNSSMASNAGNGLTLAGTGHSVLNNTLHSNGNAGLNLTGAVSCSVSNNTMWENAHGVYLDKYCIENALEDNTVHDNDVGLLVNWAYGTRIFHNNFIDNDRQTLYGGYNHWDDGKGQGNHWSDYKGADDGSGGGTAGDGVGDTKLSHKGVDRYPYINPWGWYRPGVPLLADPGEWSPTGNYTLAWSAPLRTDGYLVEESSDPEFTNASTIYNGSDTSYDVAGRLNGTFHYRVTAYNANYTGNVSGTVDIEVDQPPEAPAGFAAGPEPEGNTLTLTWHQNAVDTAHYSIHMDDGDGFRLVANVTHPGDWYRLYGLTDGTGYRFRLQAVDARGQVSAMADAITGTPGDTLPPPAPGPVTATAINDTAVSLQWVEADVDDMAGYNVHRAAWPDGNFTVINDAPVPAASYTDSGLEPGSSYRYHVTTVDEVPNESAPTAGVNVTTGMELRPPVVATDVDTLDIEEDPRGTVTLDLGAMFADPNGDPLSYWCEGQSSIGVLIFEGEGEARLTPESNWSGVEVLRLFASDGTYSVSHDVTVTVTPVNDPPVAVWILKPYDGTTTFMELGAGLLGTAGDPDLPYGDELSFTWYSNISGRLGAGPALNISLPAGLHRIRLEVSDLEGANSSAAVNLNVVSAGDSGGGSGGGGGKQDAGAGGDDLDFMSTLLFAIVATIIAMVVLFFWTRWRWEKKLEEWDRTSGAGDDWADDDSVFKAGLSLDEVAGAVHEAAIRKEAVEAGAKEPTVGKPRAVPKARSRPSPTGRGGRDDAAGDGEGAEADDGDGVGVDADEEEVDMDADEEEVDMDADEEEVDGDDDEEEVDGDDDEEEVDVDGDEEEVDDGDEDGIDLDGDELGDLSIEDLDDEIDL